VTEGSLGTAIKAGKVAIAAATDPLHPQNIFRGLSKVERAKFRTILTGLYAPMGAYGALAYAQKEGWLPDWLKVEIDPLKRHFGKLRFGDSDLDIWGGQLPIVKLLARTAEELSRAKPGGEGVDFKRLLGLWLEDFPRSKLQPVGGVGATLIFGTDFLGNDIKYDNETLFNLIVGSLTVPLSVEGTLESIGIHSTLDVLGQVAPFVGLEEGDDIDVDFQLEQFLSTLTGEALGFGSVTFRDFAEEVGILRDEHHEELNGTPYTEGTTATKAEVNALEDVEELREERKQADLASGSDFGKSRNKEETEVLSIRESGKTTTGKKVTDFTQKQIDDALERGAIDGNTWIEINRQISRDLRKWRLGFQEEEGIDFESDPPDPGSLDDLIERWWDLEP
ncbi:hypothetical protein LCGC14_2871500, partial [marine sediment metagenome]